jgi:hypothetical protein
MAMDLLRTLYWAAQNARARIRARSVWFEAPRHRQERCGIDCDSRQEMRRMGFEWTSSR